MGDEIDAAYERTVGHSKCNDPEWRHGYEVGKSVGLAHRASTELAKTPEEDRVEHDCDEGFVCCDGCRHFGHMQDLPDDHAENE